MAADSLARNMSKRTKNLNFLGIYDSAAGFCQLRDQPFALFYGYRYAVVRERKRQHRDGFRDAWTEMGGNACEMEGKCLHKMPRLYDVEFNQW